MSESIFAGPTRALSDGYTIERDLGAFKPRGPRPTPAAFPEDNAPPAQPKGCPKTSVASGER